ncbi:MAG TPA: glycosyltransferase, partial [Candidatus Eremiobacteraceae bacterium]|nr:glycosyltransferase [Candidatus Eremiobacteraceae bacterium]
MSKKSGEAASLALLFAVESTAAALWCGVVSLALLDRRAVRTLRPCAEQAGPVVTAIVPARNEAALISGWIADVVAQTDGIARILIADDSSEDETARIALAWAQRDDRVGVLTCE